MTTDREQPDSSAPTGELPTEDEPPDQRRGRLRIYLGAAPGVGKTYAMLNEGQRRKSRGTDVVIGCAETYGRPFTIKMTEGLEVIPRRTIEHHGAVPEEMDVDAVLARMPAVALVDELAHANGPGSKHPRRWQDVLEIRDGGITVITTLNIWELESLKDRVEKIIGAPVRDTVPDWVLDQADDVELVDMAPEALRSRLRHGNIYPREQAQTAMDTVFRPDRLAALRELALRRTAEEVEEQLEAYSKESDLQAVTIEERVMVCVDYRPLSAALIRKGAELARRLKAPLYVVTVRRADATDEQRAALVEHAQLTQTLGYLFHTIEENQAAQAEHERLAVRLGYEPDMQPRLDVAAALARFASEHRVTQIIMGQPRYSRWHLLLHEPLEQRLLGRLPAVEVHVIAESAANHDNVHSR